MSNAGIDYGYGVSNYDSKTGIHYGVIHHGEVGQAWYDDSEEYYEVYCPYCGGYLKRGFDAKRCPHCYKKIDSDHGDLDNTEPSAFYVRTSEYHAQQSQSDCDIFITKSPYYTLCAYCSPCAPGAGYLTEQREDGIKAYCFGHEWFEEGKAPYTVYRVSDGKVIEAPTEETEEGVK